MTAEAVITATCAAAASRELEAGRAELAARLAEAESELEAAERRMDAPRAALEPIELELAEVRSRLAQHRAADDTAPLAQRLAAKLERGALESEERELSERAHLIEDMISPLIASAGECRMQRDIAAGRLSALADAVAYPLQTERGLATEAGQEWLSRTGRWMHHLGDNEAASLMGRLSRRFLMRVLRETGLGAAIEDNAMSHARLKTDRAAGLVIDQGLVFSSARGWDGSGAAPSNLQYTQASARAESELGRWMAGGWQTSPGAYVAEVRPISGQPSGARDVSGIPSELMSP